MRAAAKLLAQIIDNRTDVGTFRTVDLKLQFIAFMANKQQLIDRNRPGFTRNLNALTSVFVQLFTLIFQRRVHRRHLLSLAAEAIQRRRQLFFVKG